jgi:hypothetical protein
MYDSMDSQIVLRLEAAATVLTDEGLVSRVRCHMALQVTASTESLPTDLAPELGLSRVTELVNMESSGIGKGFPTARLRTNVLVGLLIVRNLNVVLQEAFVTVILFTNWTLETPNSLMDSTNVGLEIRTRLCLLPAELAFEDFGSFGI